MQEFPQSHLQFQKTAVEPFGVFLLLFLEITTNFPKR
jgi:hypothetical protein